MSNLEADAQQTRCESHDAPGPSTRLLPARRVPLGGVRGVEVHRTLPHRGLPTVGAWCFADAFTPGGTTMNVLPHPHIGLQTVTWLFDGRVRHRDSLGSDVEIVPGQLNWMTSGAGVSHSEVADGAGGEGLQLWVALPASAREGPAAFEQHADLPEVRRDGLRMTVLAGEVEGARSPAATHTPLTGAVVWLEAGARVELGLDPAHEHAVQVVSGDASVAGEAVEERGMLYLGTGRDHVRLEARTPSRLLLLGGEPFDEDVLMWWNFVARTHDEVVRAREEWEDRSERFGRVLGHGDERIPAPPVPDVTLRPRRRG